jgi:hypothetical protein
MGYGKKQHQQSKGTMDASADFGGQFSSEQFTKAHEHQKDPEDFAASHGGSATGHKTMDNGKDDQQHAIDFMKAKNLNQSWGTPGRGSPRGEQAERNKKDTAPREKKMKHWQEKAPFVTKK